MLTIKDLSFFYPTADKPLWVLNDINLTIRPGEFVCLIGPSGCGKTTLLYTIAGLLKPTTGEILLDGQKNTGPSSKKAMVFQDATLLPWRNVWGNLAYGLETQRIEKSEKENRVQHYLKMVGLANFVEYYPHQLSGGMKQRVNLARALACEPEILLLDEPFASLDAQTREKMGQELLSIWQKTKKTFIFVTHQISEALFLADRVIILSGRPGRIKKELKVDFPRPRQLSIKWEKKFTEKERLIWRLIEEA